MNAIKKFTSKDMLSYRNNVFERNEISLKQQKVGMIDKYLGVCSINVMIRVKQKHFHKFLQRNFICHYQHSIILFYYSDKNENDKWPATTTFRSSKELSIWTIMPKKGQTKFSLA